MAVSANLSEAEPDKPPTPIVTSHNKPKIPIIAMNTLLVGLRKPA